ncbi:MAG: hypothetical protein OEY80_07975 [Nitrospirota bacterium]|nr:hypothetical protein [Nitrospirota bacterium]MDH4359194.1 hypothetical protein [Nitrospirota bacterium]MDH5575403.1 hypothetical protein [Nitrospirota bacterium]
MKQERLSRSVRHFIYRVFSGQGVGGTRNHFTGFGRIVVMAMSLFLIGVSEGFAEDHPQELPKPFHKTTPPLFQEWNFDQSSSNGLPEGFTQAVGGTSGEGEWSVKEDATAPSRPRLVEQRLHCREGWCYQLLVAEGVVAEYVDLSVRIKLELGTSSGKAGLAYGIQDDNNFYAVVVEPKTNEVVAYVVKDGQPTELAREVLIPSPSDWHFLRIQRNTIISKEFTEIFFDHHLMIDVYDQSFRKGKLGLVAMGDGGFSFDNLRAMEMMTNRPLSRPSAY